MSNNNLSQDNSLKAKSGIALDNEINEKLEKLLEKGVILKFNKKVNFNHKNFKSKFKL